MTQAYVRALIGDFYQYRLLENCVDKDQLERASHKIQKRYKKITEIWNKDKNSEWVLRHYLAIKMIMSATLMLNSVKYAKERNLRIVEPYLTYYSLLTVCRALIFTNPETEWNNGEIMTMTHSKIIKIASSAIRSIDSKIGNEIEEMIIKAQDVRELFSYKFPANGIVGYFNDSTLEENWETLVRSCTLIAEIAQFHSEQFQKCLGKLNETQFEIDFNFLLKGCYYKGKNMDFIDNEDYYRLGYFKRKQPYPVNLYWTLREGMVDDFFGAWQKDYEDGDEEDLELFNPDDNIRLIFDMP